MSIRACVKKSAASLLIAGLVLVSVNISGAQVLSSIPGIGNLDIANIRVVPFVQVGYKNIGFNLNLPFTVTPVDQFGGVFNGPPALDLNFRDAGVWVGSIGLDARLASALFLSLRADGNATKNISVVTGENFPWWQIQAPYIWSGSGLQWWDIDGMVGYTFFKDWSAVVGVRYDKVTVSFANPVDQTGTPINLPPNTTQLTQDIVVKTWIPYIGLQLNGPNYKASLLYSPFASPQVATPQSSSAIVLGLFSYVDSSLMNYNFASTGSFVDGYFEYDVSIRDTLLFGLWARGTWMRFSGNGDLNWLDSRVGEGVQNSVSVN